MVNEYIRKGDLSTEIFSGDGTYIGLVDNRFLVQVTAIDNEGHSRIDIYDESKPKGEQTVMILHLERIK